MAAPSPEAMDARSSVGVVLRFLKSSAGKGTEASLETASTAPTSGGAVDYAKCRLDWDAAKQKVHADLQSLEAAILSEYANTPAFAELSQKVRKLDSVLDGFADNLGDILDSAYKSDEPQQRKTYHGQAAAMVQKFQAQALSDSFIEKLQSNPFVTVNIKGALVTTLDALAKRLA